LDAALRKHRRSAENLSLGSALIDGEIVVEDEAGIPSFSLLQAELQRTKSDRFRYFAFDLLYCEGFDLTKAMLLSRKELLRQILAGLPATSVLRFSEHMEGDGATIFEHACRSASKASSPSAAIFPIGPARRSLAQDQGRAPQEFVILGYVPRRLRKAPSARC